MTQQKTVKTFFLGLGLIHFLIIIIVIIIITTHGWAQLSEHFRNVFDCFVA